MTHAWGLLANEMAGCLVFDEKITQLKKSEKRNVKTYIFQLNYYLTYIFPIG